MKKARSNHPFSITCHQFPTHCEIDMVMMCRCVSTTSIPNTKKFLELHFPDVLDTECFNEANLPFCEEVCATEMGHLFEHVILAHLRSQQEAIGNTSFCYDARTYWNWEKEKEGTFHIKISVAKNESSLLKKAITFSSQLLGDLIETADGLSPTPSAALSPTPIQR